MGGMSMMVEGHEDAGGTGGEEGVCLVKKETKAMAMQEIRKKTATPDAGHKYDDSAGGGGGGGGGCGAAVRQETTTLSVCRSSSHTRAQKTTTSVTYGCSVLDNVALFPIMTTGFVLGWQF